MVNSGDLMCDTHTRTHTYTPKNVINVFGNFLSMHKIGNWVRRLFRASTRGGMVRLFAKSVCRMAVERGDSIGKCNTENDTSNHGCSMFS